MVSSSIICRFLLLGTWYPIGASKPPHFRVVYDTTVAILLLPHPRSALSLIPKLQFTESWASSAEEKALMKFFGDDYINYRRRVGTKIPFVPWLQLVPWRLTRLVTIGRFRRTCNESDRWYAKKFLSGVWHNCTLVRHVNTIQELPDVFIADTADTLNRCSWRRWSDIIEKQDDTSYLIGRRYRCRFLPK